MKPSAPRPTPAIAIIVCALSTTLLLLSACAGDYARKRAGHYYQEGQMLANRGDTERAVLKCNKSMALAERVGFRAGVAHNLNELAIIHTNRDEFETAREELTRALAIYRDLEMNPEISKTLNNMVQTYVRQGRFADALEHYKKLIAWDEETGNRLGMAISLYNMALILDRQLNEPAQARGAYQRAMAIFREPGNEKYLEELRAK